MTGIDVSELTVPSVLKILKKLPFLRSQGLHLLGRTVITRECSGVPVLRPKPISEFPHGYVWGRSRFLVDCIRQRRRGLDVLLRAQLQPCLNVRPLVRVTGNQDDWVLHYFVRDGTAHNMGELPELLLE